MGSSSTSLSLSNGGGALPVDEDLRQSIPAYTKAGSYLLHLLAHIYNANPNLPLFSPYGNDWNCIAAGLHEQLMHYTRCLIPFHRSSDALTSRDYWDGMLTVPGADLLAHLGVLINSFVPNSMAEERTMSVLTKFNTPDRASQKVSTLFDMALIRQFYRHESSDTEVSTAFCTRRSILHKLDDQKRPHFRPIARFADLSKYIQTATLPLPKISISSSDSGSNASLEEVPLGETVDDTFEIVERYTIPVLGSREEFKVEGRDGISLSSRLLVDMISENPSPVLPVHVTPLVIPNPSQPHRHQPVDVSKLVY